MGLIMAHVYNGTAYRHGAIHPACRPCFDGIAKRWANDKMLALRLDEVTNPYAEPHPQYEPNECFYCKREN